MRWFFCLLVALTVPAQAAHAQTSQAAPEARPLVEGRYEICREAFMHSEHLELRGGRFVHQVSTDITPEQTTSGEYVVRGDTLILPLAVADGMLRLRAMHAESGGSRERLDELFPIETRMIIDELRGQTVLWRTAAMRKDFVVSGRIGPYHVLVRTGEHSLAPPSCRELGVIP